MKVRNLPVFNKKIKGAGDAQNVYYCARIWILSLFYVSPMQVFLYSSFAHGVYECVSERGVGECECSVLGVSFIAASISIDVYINVSISLHFSGVNAV